MGCLRELVSLLGFMEMVFPIRNPPTRIPPLRYTAGIFCVTGMASASCLPTSTRTSCASVVVQAGAPWTPCLRSLCGQCRSSREAFIHRSAMTRHHWSLPGPSWLGANLGSRQCCCKPGVIGNGSTRSFNFPAGVQGEFVGGARPAKMANMPIGSVAPKQLGGLQGTPLESSWHNSYKKALHPLLCFPAQASPLTWLSSAPCIASMQE